MNYFTYCKTPEEAKAKYRELSKINHPDKGGSDAVMKEINRQYDEFEKKQANPGANNNAFQEAYGREWERSRKVQQDFMDKMAEEESKRYYQRYYQGFSYRPPGSERTADNSHSYNTVEYWKQKYEQRNEEYRKLSDDCNRRIRDSNNDWQYKYNDILLSNMKLKDERDALQNRYDKILKQCAKYKEMASQAAGKPKLTKLKTIKPKKTKGAK